MKIKFKLIVISGMLLLLNMNTNANYIKPADKIFLAENTERYSQSAQSSKNDSLPEGFTDEVMKDLRDEFGQNIIPEDEGDAFQQRSFNGFATGDIYGFSVSTAGDVNGDGYDDIIIGAPQNSFAGTYAGRAYIYYGGINVNSIADVILTGETANNFFGYSVSSAGDVNGDGYSDVIAGSYGYSSFTGRAYIYYGGAVMNNSADVIMSGENAGDDFGYSVSGAGDVNGDGYKDVLIGAFGNNSLTGSSYIYFGGSSMNNVSDITFYGEFPNDNFGNSVSTAGDLNGDSYSDILIGASQYDSYTGKVYVYYGGSSMDNINDLSMTGENISNYFGTSVAGAEDLNLDGYSDLVIGAPGANGSAGRAYVYYGGASIDNIEDLILNGENPNDEFGLSVSSAGDVNGDGFSDIIAGSANYSSYKGRAYIYFGGVTMNNTSDLTITGEATVNYFGSSVSKAGDVNGDGYSDVIIGAYGFNSITGKAYLNMYGMNGTLISELNMSGSGVLTQLGQSVSSAGDVNGDGYNDVIIGAPSMSPNTGNAYIFFGGVNMDNIADVTFSGEASNDRLGQSVAAAGDVNGDGYADVIVGAYGNSTFRGKAYIFFGGAVMNNAADLILTGEAVNNYFGDAVAGAGDINGDGYADVIVGADGYNSLTGRSYVYLGGAAMNNVADLVMTGEAVNNHFGLSVSSAGDINSDGYSDMIVGAYGYSSTTGRAYVYYGGAVLNGIPDATLTGAANDYFGVSVSTAGDVNGDGFSDIIIGAYYNNTGLGKAFIYFGGTGLITTPGVIIPGDPLTSSFGFSVASASDINGDGYSDVIIGATGSFSVPGKAFVYFGGAAMNNTADIIMTGETVNTSFGNSVASAGDLNGDGSPDLIIGNVGLNSSTGKSYVYFNSSPNVHPGILSVTDVPNDQGGYAYIKWTKSSYDIPVNGLVTSYLVERSTPPGLVGYQWVSVGTVPSTQNSIYNFEARTSSDNNNFFFRVTALTNTISVKWRSNVLSGSSIDNLAPLPPLNLMAAQSGNSVNLNWNQNPENDLRQYIVYRNGIQIGTSLTLNFTDNYFSADSAFIYRIAAEDIHGNIGGLSNPAGVTLTSANVIIKVIPEGFYNLSTQKLNSKDTVRAYLHSNISPYNVIDSAIAITDSVSFAGTFRFSGAPNGTYFLAVKHRNSIGTWSATGVSLTIGSTVNYDMTSSASQSYGNNLIQVDNSPVRYAIFSGDVNQDGIVDASDLSEADNDALNSLSGYVRTDVTGDDFVDAADVSIIDNNSFNSVSVVTP
ncbi:MAG: FG-GAP repeat protein [Ignavibacteria bacterium]|nr:FG-GAP repeat protein [Ignavibacteria bacterium]